MSYNIQQGLIVALQQILSNPANHQDVLLFSAYQAAIYNNWQSDAFAKMVGTAVVAWEMHESTNTWPQGHVSTQDREDYICDLIISMSGAALIARDANLMYNIGPQGQQRVQRELQNAQNLAQDLEAYQRSLQTAARGTNSRYGNVRGAKVVPQQPTASGGHARYGRTAAAPVVQQTTRNEPTEEAVAAIPFVLKRGKEMDYANHKLSHELSPGSRRKAPVKDFMGDLANADIVAVTEETAPNLNITKAIAPNSIPVATSIEHAKTLAMIEIANAGGTVTEDHLLEYSYQQLNTLKVFTDDTALQIFSVSQPSLGTIKLAEDIETAAECIKSLLESENPFAVSIGRRLNSRATKMVNDELNFRIVIEQNIEDFAEDASSVAPTLRTFAPTEQDFLDAWLPAQERILESLRCIYLGPETDEDSKYVDLIMAGDVAKRSIFWMEPIYVSFLPIAFYHLNIDTNFSAIGQAFLRQADHPELYNAFRGVLARAYDSRGTSYQRVIVVTDDNVRLELVETDVVGDHDKFAHILIRAA
jgi:hypothetical protein